MLTQTLTRHPVAQAELRHQFWVINTSRSGQLWIWVAYILLYPSIAVSIAVLLLALLSPYAPALTAPVLRVLAGIPPGAAPALVLTMNIAQFVVVTMMSFGLAAHSISREKEGHTWDMLILTHVSARQIVWGKWWASATVLARDHLLLALLRLGVAAYMMVNFRPFVLYPPTVLGFPPVVTYTVGFTLLVMAYTITEAALTTALGVLAPLLSSHPGLGVAVALSTRGGLLFLTFALPIWLVQHYPEHSLQPFFLGGLLMLMLHVLAAWLAMVVAEWAVLRGTINLPE